MTKLAIFKRKLSIDETAMQMASLQDMMYDAWKNRNDLTREQRAKVLANLVEQIRQETGEEKAKAEAKLLRAEVADDIVRGIRLFGVF